MKETNDGMLKRTNPNKVNMPNKDVVFVEVLYQNKVGETFKACNDNVDYPKYAIFLSFCFGFMEKLPWDPGEWAWKDLVTLKVTPFFGYNLKRGYKTLLMRQ
jgi:hypothetical protein